MQSRFDLQQFATVIVTALSASPAIACDISRYDRSPPAAIIDKVNDATFNFEWATDVDTSDGRNWIWHYVKNLRDHGFGYRWPKADLRRALGSPLEAGKIDCRRYFVSGTPALDDNAPLTYGTNETVQRAVVFADSKPTSAQSTGAQSTGSIIETSYKVASGAIENVRVVVGTTEGQSEKDRWQFFVEQTPNVVIAISMPTSLNGEQYAALTAQLKADFPVKADVGTLKDLYSDSELANRTSQQYLVLNSRLPKAAAVIPASALRHVSSDLMLADQEGRTFFATTVRLLVPGNDR
jgi:hypothetical protein